MSASTLSGLSAPLRSRATVSSATAPTSAIVFTTRLRRSAAALVKISTLLRRHAGGEERIELSALVAERGDRRGRARRTRRGSHRARRASRRPMRTAENGGRVGLGQRAPVGGGERRPASSRRAPARRAAFPPPRSARSSLPGGEQRASARSLRFSPEMNSVGSRTQITFVPPSRLGRAQAVEDRADRRAAPVVALEAEAAPLRRHQQIDQRARHAPRSETARRSSR